MTWLKLTKKALQLKQQNSNESIEEVKVESNPNNPTEDWIEEFPTKWFEGEDAPKIMIISNYEYEPQNIEKGAIKLKILEKLEALYPNTDISQKLKELSQDDRVDVNIFVLAFYSTLPISKEKFKEPSTQQQLKKICKFLGCEINDLKEEQEEDIPLFKFDIDLHIRKYYQSEAQFIEETGASVEFIDLLRTQHIDIYLFTSLIGGGYNLDKVKKIGRQLSKVFRRR